MNWNLVCAKICWLMDVISICVVRLILSYYCLLSLTLPHVAQKLIQQDPRNNSAWNQRWFASHRAKKDPLTLDMARSEMDFAIEKGAQIDP